MRYHSLENLVKSNSGAFEGRVLSCKQEGSVDNDGKIRVASADAKLTVRVEKTDADGKTSAIEVPVFVKLCLAGTQAEKFNKLLKTFDKEAYFFTSIAPKMRSFARSKLDDKAMYYVPLCYGTGEIDGMGGPALLLDDFSARNLRVTGKEVFHSVPQVEISLRALAEFHAVSQAMMTKGDLVESQEPMLVDMLKAEGTVLEDFFCKPIQGSVLLLREAIGKFDSLTIPAGVTAELLDDLAFVGSAEIAHHFAALRTDTTGSDKFRVLCHGDFHMWNVAFNLDDPADKESLAVFDYQITYFGDLTTDIMQYLTQASTPRDRSDGGMDKYLSAYHGAFAEAAARLGIPKEKTMTLAELRTRCLDRSPVLFMFAICFVLPRLVEDGQALYGGCTKTKEGRQKWLSQAGEREVAGLQFMFDLMGEWHEMGTLDKIIAWRKK